MSNTYKYVYISKVFETKILFLINVPLVQLRKQRKYGAGCKWESLYTYFTRKCEENSSEQKSVYLTVA